MKTTILIASLLASLVGCIDSDVKPQPLPTCEELGASANLFCTRDGTCSYEGTKCSASGSGSGSAGDTGQTVGSGDAPAPADDSTCAMIAADADPACFVACANLAGFMTGVAPGSCRFVSCALDGGGTREIGACVDGAK